MSKLTKPSMKFTSYLSERYTEDSKKKAVAWANQQKACGWSNYRCAVDMYISSQTLKVWTIKYGCETSKKSLVSGSNVKLCVGDKVRVNEGICSGRVHFNPAMREYIGKEFIVTRVSDDNTKLKGSHVDAWNWDVKWLEKVCEDVPQQPRVVYIEAGDRNSPLMSKFMESYKCHGTGERVHVYKQDGSYRTYAKGISPKDWSRDQYLSYSKVGNILQCGVPYCEPKPKVCGVVNKEEWLVALIGGAIGGQSGNDTQRWRYNKAKGSFESKYMDGWRAADIAGLTPTAKTFSIINEVVMTIKEIEKALCVTNLKVVK